MRRRKKRSWGLLKFILALFVILCVVLMVKTLIYPFAKVPTANTPSIYDGSFSEQSIRRLSGGIQIPTISNVVYEETDFRPFDAFKSYLSAVYPQIYEKLDTMTINTYGLVFRWKGKNPGLKPILFLSHYDVVPIDNYDFDFDYVQENLKDSVFDLTVTKAQPIQEYQTQWDHPPFSGDVIDGRIYGRGTLDMKGMLFSIMEAADTLLKEDFQPERDIWFAFGHDEETGGLNGAIHIARYFQEQGIIFDAVYDEGSFVLAPGVGGVNKPLALVGLGEKGFLTMKIRVRGMGGHSSMPPKKGSLVMAAEIIEKLNKNQMPARIIEPVESFLNHTGKEMGFLPRLAIANQWLMKPVLLNSLGSSPASNALIRTTTAVSMAKGSEAPNVLSAVSEITVNFRILQGDSVAGVLEHVKEICKEYDVEIEVTSSREPSGISPENTRGYEIIKNTINKIYPEVIFTSYITIGGTDAYKYQVVSDHIYRFMPAYINAYEQQVIHNENEHISIENYMKMILYFREVMRNYDRVE